MDVSLNINGFETAAHYDDSAVESLFLPLLRELTARQRRLGRRLIAFLAAPPAVGKSTLAAFLAMLSRQDRTLAPLQTLGLDGFHFHQDYLLSHALLRDGAEIPMSQIKGAPETFDVEKLRHALADVQRGDLLWPLYDRRLHDVVENAIPVTAPVLLIEGNWLLLRDPAWASLPRDISVFITADEGSLRERLIRRKMRGGLARPDAEAFFRRSDGPNIRRCLSDSLPADHRWYMADDGSYLPL